MSNVLRGTVLTPEEIRGSATTSDVLLGEVSAPDEIHGTAATPDVLRGTVLNPEKIYGKSAYEIAVMYGKADGMTEKEWLESLYADVIVREELKEFLREQISTHNTHAEAHNDIRVMLGELNTKLTNFLNGEFDADLDQAIEIVEYIKANRGLIDAVTKAKVNVTDIVDDLITPFKDRPLSANQGALLNNLINSLDTRVKAIEQIPYAEEVSV